jgi:hypothetical protein
VHSPVLEIPTIEHDVDGRVVWCSTISYNGADVSLELTALAGGAVPSTGESTTDPTIGIPANPFALPGNDQRGTSLFSHGH